MWDRSSRVFGCTIYLFISIYRYLFFVTSSLCCSLCINNESLFFLVSAVSALFPTFEFRKKKNNTIANTKIMLANIFPNRLSFIRPVVPPLNNSHPSKSNCYINIIYSYQICYGKDYNNENNYCNLLYSTKNSGRVQ